MRFAAADKYAATADQGIWTPRGIPQAVQSDSGLNAFVADPLAAQKLEVQFAGDALGQYTNVLNAKSARDTQLEAYKNAGGGGGGSSSGSGLGRTIGQVAGTAAGFLIPGAQPFTGALATAGGGIGDVIGGFFG